MGAIKTTLEAADIGTVRALIFSYSMSVGRSAVMTKNKRWADVEKNLLSVLHESRHDVGQDWDVEREPVRHTVRIAFSKMFKPGPCLSCCARLGLGSWRVRKHVRDVVQLLALGSRLG